MDSCLGDGLGKKMNITYFFFFLRRRILMNEAEQGNNVELNIPHISQLRTRTVSRSFLECLLLHFFDGEIRWIRGLGFGSFLL